MPRRHRRGRLPGIRDLERAHSYPGGAVPLQDHAVRRAVARAALSDCPRPARTGGRPPLRGRCCPGFAMWSLDSTCARSTARPRGSRDHTHSCRRRPPPRPGGPARPPRRGGSSPRPWSPPTLGLGVCCHVLPFQCRIRVCLAALSRQRPRRWSGDVAATPERCRRGSASDATPCRSSARSARLRRSSNRRPRHRWATSAATALSDARDARHLLPLLPVRCRIKVLVGVG